MQNHRPANVVITGIVYIVYIGLLILFGFQTWQFVNFLFPDDQLTMKVLTLISFDVMALLWGVADLYYAFASKGAKTAVRTAWVITFLLSLVASILYLAIQAFFRFHIGISVTMVDWGYTISLFALTFNIIILMFFIYLEWNARHPHQDEFVGPWIAPRQPKVPTGGQQVSLAQTGTTVTPSLSPEATAQIGVLMAAYHESGDDVTMSFPEWMKSVTGSLVAVGAQPKNAKRPIRN